MMDVMTTPGRRTRRRHSAPFKTQVVAACLEPGVSLAAVALANQLNANLLRQWVKAHRQATPEASCAGDGAEGMHGEAAPTLVPVRVQTSAVTGTGDIRVTIRRGQTVVEVAWPVSAAEVCGRWLNGVLR
jgi:transposase-like protein